MVKTIWHWKAIAAFVLGLAVLAVGAGAVSYLARPQQLVGPIWAQVVNLIGGLLVGLLFAVWWPVRLYDFEVVERPDDD